MSSYDRNGEMERSHLDALTGVVVGLDRAVREFPIASLSAGQSPCRLPL